MMPRYATYLLLVPFILAVTLTPVIIAFVVDPTGFSPWSWGARGMLVFVAGVAAASPVLAGSNSAALAAYTPEQTNAFEAAKRLPLMWVVLASVAPAGLLALLHQRIGYLVFWCIHDTFQPTGCLPVNYQAVVPQALPNVLPIFAASLGVALVLIWAAIRLGVFVGRRVQPASKAVTWTVVQTVLIVTAVLVVAYVIMMQDQPRFVPTGEFEVWLRALLAYHA